MAGSRKWFVYTDENADTYAINLDESNTEAVNGTTTGQYPTTGGPTIGVPITIIPRELFYSNPARTRTIRVVALTPGVFTSAVTGSPASITDPIAGAGNNLVLVRANGERRRAPTPIDTGLTDGDN